MMLLTTTAHADMLFTTAAVAKVRNGPGINHALIDEIPAGNLISASRCVPRDDNMRGADWCLVNYPDSPTPRRQPAGWVSQAVLLPYQEPAPQGESSLECEPPVMVAGTIAEDGNPVVRTDIRYSIDDGAWHVRHILRSGQMVSRDEQYAMTDESNLKVKVLRWSGPWVRNPSYYMVGTVEKNPRGEIVYAETQYKNSALRFQSIARCRVVAG
ncbi:SH3 domain-containing protein [Bradyrhizobium japonicum]|uniref:SH3 domain-containing protein n=1 Tax=Bradyrhizobium japonicum TaxID=375 RepID=UPI001E2F8A3E|nr:SH3 domain-containing protein [Bradyrhizobium japonicum]MCD9821189.1 SH3 domain-containing protein [Bradyrhizobium japonicum]MEB2674114.1 SH3 domain-containing protein [Bradyrhizobium japonicum]WRI93301.1 SH3 domain-containing protein [Bradyrhizobium japonicum]